MEGFINLHKRILDWEWYDDINTKVLFIHILLKTNWKDTKRHGIDIKRGELLTGRKILSKETRLTEAQIRTSLEKLKTTNEITIKTTKQYSIIGVVNYDIYNQPISQQNNQRVATTKKDNNIYIELDENFLLEYKNNKLMIKVIDILKNCNIQQQINTKKAKEFYDYVIEKAKEYKLIRLIDEKWDTMGLEIMLDKFKIYYEEEPIKNIKSKYLTWLNKNIGKKQ